MTDVAIPDSLPPHWQSVSMKWLLRFRNGADYGDVVDDSGAVPVIGSGGEFARASAHLFDGESVLFGRKGTVDRPLHIDGRFWTVDTMYYTELGPRIFGRFLYYFARTIPYSLLSTSTALPSMTQSTLGAVRVPLPPIEEQRAIADFLDRETAQIDAMVDAQERLVALLEERRSAAITQAVTKGLSPEAGMRPAGVDWCTEIPSNWDVMTLRHELAYLTSGSRGWAEYYAENGDIFLRIGNLPRGVLKLKLDDLQRVVVPHGAEGSRSRVRMGDLLFSITAYIGSVAVADSRAVGAYVSQHVALARLAGRRLHPSFVGYFALSDPGQRQLKEQAYGGTKIQLSLEDIRRLQVTVPPADEQLEIVRHLDAVTASTDEMIAKARESITLMKERRAAVISAAVTGRIDVRTGIEQVERDLEEARA